MQKYPGISVVKSKRDQYVGPLQLRILLQKWTLQEGGSITELTEYMGKEETIDPYKLPVPAMTLEKQNNSPLNFIYFSESQGYVLIDLSIFQMLE